MTMLQQLAIKWRERQAALGYKGKRAEAAVFEYFIGAASALDLAGHEEAQHVATCTALILATAPFPLALADRWARAATDEACAASGPQPQPKEPRQ
jgi:hypothetical protein